jgi:hypothetical protein
MGLNSYGQEIAPGLTANNKGIGVQLFYQEIFTEGDFKFGPRFGITWHPLNPDASHFYYQNIIEYKNFFFSPFWLRSYSKSIGYQIPTTIGYRRKTEIADVELWGNYVLHARSFDLHITIIPIKRAKLSYINPN